METLEFTKTRIEQPNSVNSAFDELLHKMYISNVQNRLRQLNEPSENDKRRWVWELIQNAKDSISNDPTRNTVDIKLIVRDDTVIFKHNGSPFTAKAQLGLLYKYSEGKDNSSESTGRFGTGFLTTHSLSKIVSIEGDILTDSKDSPICGFSATMFRDGQDAEELLKGVEKMRNSMIYTQELNHWTTYTYHLKTIQNRDALRLGMENFIANITQTMLFCRELGKVTLDNNGTVTTIERLEEKLLEDNIYISEFKVQGENQYSRRFIHKSLNQLSDELTEKFRTERNIRLTGAIEVDHSNNVLEIKNSPAHFCVLPLVGSENHLMPIYLNSPDFEPDSERESLILNGNEKLEDKNVISETGINRLILKKSVSIYDSLANYLSNNKFTELYNLVNGLKNVPRIKKNFDADWFKDEIINSYRSTIKNYEVVETSNGNQKLFNNSNEQNIFIPKDSVIENQERIYELISSVYSDNIPLKEHANHWAEKAWKECGLFKIEDLCELVSDRESFSSLPDKLQDYDWFNDFLSFLKENDESLLKEYNLIPNFNGDFISLENEDFSEGVNLSNYLIETLYNLGEDIKPNLIDGNITAISLPVKIAAENVAEKINSRVMNIINNNNLTDQEKLDEFLPLVNTIPTDIGQYENEFIHKQKKIKTFINDLYWETDKVINNDIPEKAWEALHKWLIQLLMRSVSGYECVDSLPDTIDNRIDWINDFIAFISPEIKEGDLDNYKIIPNQKEEFCSKSYLSKDVDIPSELKSDQAEEFGIKLRDELVHKGVESTVNILKEKNINSVIEIVNKLFKENDFEYSSRLEFAIYLAHFVPQSESMVFFNSQNALMQVVRKYYYSACESLKPVPISWNIEDFWSKANNEIIKSLLEQIESKETLADLKLYLSKSGKDYDTGDTIIFLNDLYDYLKSTNRPIASKIVPNQNGVFCSLDGDLFRDENIPQDLKAILKLIDSENDFKNILADISLSIQPTYHKSIKDISTVIDETIKKLYTNASNWDNDNFKAAIELLMMNWFPRTGREENKDNFKYTYSKKETIEMNVLWSLEERKRMQRVRSISPDLLDEIIEKNGGIDSLEKKKEELEAEISKLQAKVDNNVSNQIASEFPDMTVDRIKELLKLEERVRGWNADDIYTPNNEHEERRNYENGYKGEAYVYSQLKKSNQFKNIIWAHKSDIPTEMEIVDYEGNKHYVREDFAEYDLTAETLDGKRLYFEVKSTRTTLRDANRINLPISTNEWNYVDGIDKECEYYLARVFDVENEPEGHYLSMMGRSFQRA